MEEAVSKINTNENKTLPLCEFMASAGVESTTRLLY
jgi:hypothetical protein